MGQRQSKDELLYHQVSYGNIEGIKALHSAGAGLEWIDKEGKTPLILACIKPDYIHVAKTLIELGANLNAYRPGSHAGCPLHHAAKRGLDQTVKLLLSHGACATVMNDDCQTPLDLARVKGHTNVVRTIENHICLFSGWLREMNLPGFLEAFARQWVSRKIWVVVVPSDSHNHHNLHKLELAIYNGLEIAQPRTVIQLWKAGVLEPNFDDTDPVLVIIDKSKTKYKFLSASEGEKQQLRLLYNACTRMLQVYFPTPAASATAPASSAEDVELAMALSASLQSAIQERLPELESIPTGRETGGSEGSNSMDGSGDRGWNFQAPLQSKVTRRGWADEPVYSDSNGWGITGEIGDYMSTRIIPPTVSAPSAPPAPDCNHFDGPVHYPTIDVSPVELSVPGRERKSVHVGSVKDGGSDSSTSCVICLDAPKEGVCVPCGHVVGCMSCLCDIKSKDWGCPVCRAKISQVIKLYTV